METEKVMAIMRGENLGDVLKEVARAIEANDHIKQIQNAFAALVGVGAEANRELLAKTEDLLCRVESQSRLIDDLIRLSAICLVLRTR